MCGKKNRQMKSTDPGCVCMYFRCWHKAPDIKDFKISFVIPFDLTAC